MKRASIEFLLVAVAALAASAPEARAQAETPKDGGTGGDYWGYTPAKTPLAEIIDSQGRYLVNVQQAAILREKARKAGYDTRRKEVEHWVWEREYKQEARLREQVRTEREQIQRAMDDPPASEIYSGDALNILLDQLKKLPPPPDGSVALESTTLEHINIRVKSDYGVGLLRKPYVAWPPLLSLPDFTDDRTNFEKQLAKVNRQGRDGKVNQDDLLVLIRMTEDLEKRLKAGFRDPQRDNDVAWSFTNYNSAQRLLGQIKSATFTLQHNPESALCFRVLTGQTVQEVVTFMRKNGLNFGAAVSGDERHYLAFQRCLSEELNRARKYYPDPNR